MLLSPRVSGILIAATVLLCSIKSQDLESSFLDKLTSIPIVSLSSVLQERCTTYEATLRQSLPTDQQTRLSREELFEMVLTEVKNKGIHASANEWRVEEDVRRCIELAPVPASATAEASNYGISVHNGAQQAEGVLASCDLGDEVDGSQANVDPKKKSGKERCKKLRKTLRHIFKRSRPADGVKYEAREVANKSPAGLLTLRGFKSEEHYAITKDGYHLHLIRIINPALPPDFKLKRPVLFNHGFIESSTLWLINSKGVKPAANIDHCHSLPIDIELAKTSSEFTNAPMMLANNGYDVWLLSMRGTDWSLNHDTLDTSSPKFWDFSFDEFALIDVPTAINYIKRATNAPKVGYIGHSQATWTVFTLLATETQYADIIEPVVAVGPFAYIERVGAVGKLFFNTIAAIEQSDGRLPESPRKYRAALRTVCRPGGWLSLPFVCKLLNTLLGGSSEELPAGYFAHLPYSTSHKVVRHISQLVKSKVYQKYDHGKEENLRRYGTAEPPSYDLGNIRSKSLMLVYSRTDQLTTMAAVEELIKGLKVPLYRSVFVNQDINHFGLLLSKDASWQVNLPILEAFESFSYESGDCRPQTSSPPSVTGDHLPDNEIPHDDQSL